MRKGKTLPWQKLQEANGMHRLLVSTLRGCASLNFHEAPWGMTEEEHLPVASVPHTGYLAFTVLEGKLNLGKKQNGEKLCVVGCHGLLTHLPCNSMVVPQSSSPLLCRMNAL